MEEKDKYNKKNLLLKLNWFITLLSILIIIICGILVSIQNRTNNQFINDDVMETFLVISPIIPLVFNVITLILNIVYKQKQFIMSFVILLIFQVMNACMSFGVALLALAGVLSQIK